MSRLDFCKYELVDDCYDWKNDNCDECNIFKAYCEGARRAKNSIVRCRDCRFYSNDHLCEQLSRFGSIEPLADFYCAFGERREKNDYIPQD